MCLQIRERVILRYNDGINRQGSLPQTFRAMALKYRLEACAVSKSEGMLARVVDVRTVGFEELVSLMSGRGSSLTDTQIIGVVTELARVIEQELAKGHAVATPLFRAGHAISGRFEGPGDQFDPSRHELRVALRPSASLAAAQKRAVPVKEAVSSRQPCITGAHGFGQRGRSGTIPSGGACQISGRFLRPAGCRLELWASQGGLRIPFPPAIKHTPASIIALMPQGLAEGMALLSLGFIPLDGGEPLYTSTIEIFVKESGNGRE